MPWWVKTCVWIFIVFGAIAPIALVFALLGFSFEMSLYGLNAQGAYSITGFSLIGFFLLKGVTSVSLWMEKDWAINLGFVDAILGLVVCGYVMIVPFFYPSYKLNLRLELVLMIPYLLWLIRIKPRWEESRKG